MQKKRKHNRIAWLDMVRSLAILCVIMCHCVERTYSMNLEGMADVTGSARSFAFLAFTVGRLGVPLFLFLSGYLLLGRPYNSGRDVLNFWKRKLLPLVITFECWTILNEVFAVFVEKMQFDWHRLVRNMLCLDTQHASHMWYMPMIIGMYLTIPFLGMVVQRFSVKLLMVPFIAGVLYYFVVPTVNPFLEVLEIEPWSNKLGLDFTGGCYGIYLVLGYVMRKQMNWLRGRLRLYKVRILGVCSALAGGAAVVLLIAATASYQSWCYAHGVRYNVWYNCIPLFFSAVILFWSAGFLGNCHIPFSGFWNCLSEASMGIFFIHKPMIIVLEKELRFSGEKISDVMGLFLVCFLVSFLLAVIGGYIPGISRILFLKSGKRKRERIPG